MNSDCEKSFDEMTPLERVEQLYEHLLSHYGDAQDREARAAAKLLLVALDRFSRSGTINWESIVNDYVDMAINDQDKFNRVMAGNRGAPRFPESQ